MNQTKNNVVFTQDLYGAFAQVGIPFPKCKLERGQFVRFPTDGTQADDAGWCKLFPDGIGAVFGDYRTGEKYVWQQRDLHAPPPSADELKEARRRAKEQREQAEADLAAKHAQGRETAVRIFADSTELEAAHPYVMQKGITPFGARQCSDGVLVLPVFGPDDELQSLQFIEDDGGKRFLTNGKMKSGRLILGDPVEGLPLIVCEGWATGCSLHEATGQPTVICFNGSNLAAVVQDLGPQYPNTRIVVAGDLDKSGAGKRYAEDAIAVAANAVAVYPVFADGRDAGDFNDLHKAEGIEAVEGLIRGIPQTAVVVPVTDVIGPSTVPNLPGFDVRNGTATTHPLTDYGNAQRLFDLVGNRLKYVFDINKWLVWDGTAWQWDDGSWVYTLAAKQLPVMLHAEAGQYLSHSIEFAKWSRQCQQQKVLTNAISALKNFQQVRVSLASLDADDTLVGFDNARQVLDLRTGRARSATPVDYVTKSLNVTELGDPDRAERWTQFLCEVFRGDLELLDWFQRFCGYLLTASTEEQFFLFLHGRGANGKSVLAETLKHLMGDYARVVAPETLCATNRQGGAATPDLVPLVGARMVMSSEAEENSKFAQSRIKSLVAGDSMTVRANYGEPITFTPVMKLIITGNHMPDYSGNDGGLERRLKIIPFKKTFAPEERDQQLPAKLREEAAHILAWMAKGCLEWRRRGLSDTPRAVLEATASYKEDQDIIGQWLKECTESSSSDLPCPEAYDNYTLWAQDNGIRPISSRKFNSGLRDRGRDIRKSNSKMLISGLALTDFRHSLRGGVSPERKQVQPVPRPVLN
ncbi:phage/plasmid primase, P4 family [Cupriavidus sp. BIC8F]|uniref:phage/plasmid primase, P4 family n=1 Tax=Cupriavidus sp. BIC8F TaxID=3079014 RepID=UPI0029169BDB|nr:phage/plasmid primase, P4 family [Cupriavidus sp. BIC8F]